jgi:outer membrane protein, adhesin transport system
VAAEVETLPGLIDEMRLVHPELASRRAERIAADESLLAARWGRFPTLGLSGDYDRDDNHQAALRIEQPIWAGGRISGQIALQQAAVDVAAAALAQLELELIEQLAQLYYEQLRLQQRLYLVDSNLTAHGELLATIQRRVDAQVSPAADALLAESRLHQVRSERVALLRQIAEGQSRLSQMLQRDLNGLAPPDALPLTLQGRPLTLADLEALAIDYSPRRQQLLAEAAERRADSRLARSQLLPTVIVGYEYQIDPPGAATKADDRLYLSLRVESGAGLSALAVRRSALARQQAAESRADGVERELRQSVQSLWAEATRH